MNEPFGAESPSDDPLRRAAEAMRAVRERCVWSQRITHDDLVPYLVEESAELIDAVETGTRADLREELGDRLTPLQKLYDDGRDHDGVRHDQRKD